MGTHRPPNRFAAFVAGILVIAPYKTSVEQWPGLAANHRL